MTTSNGRILLAQAVREHQHWTFCLEASDARLLALRKLAEGKRVYCIPTLLGCWLCACCERSAADEASNAYTGGQEFSGWTRDSLEAYGA